MRAPKDKNKAPRKGKTKPATLFEAEFVVAFIDMVYSEPEKYVPGWNSGNDKNYLLQDYHVSVGHRTRNRSKASYQHRGCLDTIARRLASGGPMNVKEWRHDWVDRLVAANFE
jgi:hypothetical protein